MSQGNHLLCSATWAQGAASPSLYHTCPDEIQENGKPGARPFWHLYPVPRNSVWVSSWLSSVPTESGHQPGCGLKSLCFSLTVGSPQGSRASLLSCPSHTGPGHTLKTHHNCPSMPVITEQTWAVERSLRTSSDVPALPTFSIRSVKCSEPCGNSGRPLYLCPDELTRKLTQSLLCLSPPLCAIYYT